jgi:hydroxymethylpyrimidine pyrophosphatase-like HAD family hydrolase
MVGAGGCERIYKQMGEYPIDIIGNYGMQESKMIDGKFVIVKQITTTPDKEYFLKQAEYIRNKYGYTEYKGETIEFHSTGMVTFPFLGTKADINDKVAFDPDRAKRKVVYPEVLELFPDYTVFIGGSSSFDLVPTPHDKYYALANLCADEGYSHDEVLYVGDDYGVGGNDEAVAKSDIAFVTVDDYTKLSERLAFLL